MLSIRHYKQEFGIQIQVSNAILLLILIVGGWDQVVLFQAENIQISQEILVKLIKNNLFFSFWIKMWMNKSFIVLGEYAVQNTEQY